ncbi:MAG: serine/threonine protein kinase [Planctomycetota bacterium]|nr:MAG: serine/threonine protein kinase [Planctomycetota bacterium]
MALTSVDDLRETLIDLKLVTPDQWAACLQEIDGTLARSPDAVLNALAQRHVLTSYQVHRLRQGEVDGLVLGRYKLLYRNAAGSFARVFRAADVDTGGMYAVKVLRQRWARDPEAVEAFHREAELCLPFRHKNIVRIFEVGSQGDYHYFSMEFVEGGNLRDFIRIRKKLEPLEATRYALDIAEGLEYALARGVTHRDLKMTNVLISTEGVAKLVDFGLAGCMRGEENEATQRALEYAAIEEGTGAPNNDPRSDLFFLGAIYYELLAGEPPYERTRSREERRRISRYVNVPPLEQVAPEVPPSTVRIVKRLMQIDPRLRYQSPTELIADLRAELELLGRQKSDGPVAVASNNGDERPAVIFAENRRRHQDVLRRFFTEQGYRVLVISDLQRSLQRLEAEPAACLVILGEGFGEAAFPAIRRACAVADRQHKPIVAVIPRRFAQWSKTLPSSENLRVLTQPISLGELHRAVGEVCSASRAGS